MSRDECLDRLRTHTVGRVSVTDEALPVIVPVNYRLDGSGIIFRTRSDGILARACHSNVVAFEIDDVGDAGMAGWSVLVVGVADALDASERMRAENRGLVSAAGPDRDHFVKVTLGRVTGREISPAAAVTALS